MRAISEACPYDADGNMAADGRGWRYFWNGENRMVCASNDEAVVTYAYDHRGRMVRALLGCFRPHGRLRPLWLCASV